MKRKHDVNLCKRFHESFDNAMDTAVRWCSARDGIWVDSQMRLQDLHLQHYAGGSCPVWRVTVNLRAAYVFRQRRRTVYIGAKRYSLPDSSRRRAPRYPLLSCETGDIIASELTFHGRETEVIAAWLAQSLSARLLHGTTPPEPPVCFMGQQEDVLPELFGRSGYVWTHAAWITCNAARDQRDAKEELRARRRERQSHRRDDGSPPSALSAS